MRTVVVSVKVCVVENVEVAIEVVLNVLVKLAGAGLTVSTVTEVVVVVTVVFGVGAVMVLETVEVLVTTRVVDMMTVHWTLCG